MRVTYGPWQVSCTILFMHAPILCLPNERAYIAATVSYRYEMIMKLPPGEVGVWSSELGVVGISNCSDAGSSGASVIKLYLSIIYEFFVLS